MFHLPFDNHGLDCSCIRESVSSDVFTKGVFLDFRDFDCVLSDNFFSLTGPEPYKVIARTDRNAVQLRENVEIKTVYDIR